MLDLRSRIRSAIRWRSAMALGSSEPARDEDALAA
jgi:hypothetical protein